MANMLNNICTSDHLGSVMFMCSYAYCDMYDGLDYGTWVISVQVGCLTLITNVYGTASILVMILIQSQNLAIYSQTIRPLILNGWIMQINYCLVHIFSLSEGAVVSLILTGKQMTAVTKVSCDDAGLPLFPAVDLMSTNPAQLVPIITDYLTQLWWRCSCYSCVVPFLMMLSLFS